MNIEDDRLHLSPDGVGARISPVELWEQAEGDGDRYRELMRQHGHIVPGKRPPGEDIFGHRAPSAAPVPASADLDVLLDQWYVARHSKDTTRLSEVRRAIEAAALRDAHAFREATDGELETKVERLATEYEALAVEVETTDALLSDGEVRTIYAAYAAVLGLEARTIEGQRGIVEPIYRAVIQARINTARAIAAEYAATEPAGETDHD